LSSIFIILRHALMQEGSGVSRGKKAKGRSWAVRTPAGAAKMAWTAMPTRYWFG
jgi:hypothetical protein